MDLDRFRTDVTALQRELNAVRATAHSPDGLVTVGVDGRGLLVDLTLDPRIYRTTDAKALARTITETQRRAVDSAQAQVFRLSKGILAPDSTPDTADLAFDPLLHQLDQRLA